MSFSTKIAAGAVAGALTVLGGLTAASAMNSDVADATGHVLPLAATSHSADAKADTTDKSTPSADATEAPEAPEATEATEAADTADKPDTAKPAGTTTCPAGDEHGKAVSTVAKQDPAAATGDAHGDAVSAVANCNRAGHPETDAKADHTGGTHEPTAPAMTGDSQADTHGPSSSTAPGQSDARNQDANGGSGHGPNAEANANATSGNPGAAHR